MVRWLSLCVVIPAGRYGTFYGSFPASVVLRPYSSAFIADVPPKLNIKWVLLSCKTLRLQSSQREPIHRQIPFILDELGIERRYFSKPTQNYIKLIPIFGRQNFTKLIILIKQ